MKRLLLIYFSILLQGFLFGQNPVYHHINDENGLPSNEVYSIIQDHHGFIWIGCDAGLYRYNGLKFIQYQNAGQKSAAITGLVLSGDSVIYCYNFSNQIFFVEKDSLHELTSWQGKRDNGFTRIAIGNYNTLWATANAQLCNYNPRQQKWKALNVSTHNKFAPANLLATDNGSKIWTGVYDTVVCIQNGLIQKFPVVFKDGDSRNLSEYNFFGDANVVWFKSLVGNSLYQLKDGVFRLFESERLDLAFKDRKSTFHVADKQYIYTTTYSGFVVYDKWNDIAQVLFAEETFSAYLKDKDGNVWLTTLRKGIYFIPAMDFQLWNSASSGIPEDRITDVVATGNTLYFSMLNGYIGALDVATGKVKTYFIGIKADITTMFFDEAAHCLYFNCNKGLYSLQQGQIKLLHNDNAPVKKIVKAGAHYVVCTSFGAYIYNALNPKKEAQVITTSWARDAAYVQSSQTLFIATNEGLIGGKLIEGVFKQDATYDKGVQHKALFFDSLTSTLLSLSYKGAIHSYSNGKFGLLSTIPEKVLPNDIEVDGQRIFVATNKGLWIFNRTSKAWSHLNRVSGIASNDILSIKVAGYKLWLATAKGLQSIPLNYEASKQLPKIVLNNVWIDNRSVAANNIRLNYNQYLSISAEAIAYASMQNFQFAYRTNATDTNWMYVNGSNDRIVLSRMPTGNFAIEVKAVDYLGRFSENSIHLKGKVVPPFWQRWWFYVLVAVSGIGLAYSVFLLRLKSLRKKQQQALEKLALENELKLSQQTALKAQMNPHFLFNVLNSIKSFIYENDKKSAAEYLNKFAELVRGILTMSSLPMVKLSDEVKALELYIQLEAMLLEPPFEYTLKVEESIDADAISIPSLIIQPFVENAFKHGLRHKQGKKNLQIRIELNEATRQLKVCIEDNGIGRAQSAALNNHSLPSHPSFATKANAQRLALLNRDADEKVSVQFEDKIDAQGMASGTVVILNIGV